MFLSCSLSLRIEFCFRAFKNIGFYFYNYMTYSIYFFLTFSTPCFVFSSNVEKVCILLQLLDCLWLLMIFDVCSISLILSLFLSSSRFSLSL